MGMTLKRFQAEVARQREGRRRGAGRYSGELRAFAVAHAEVVKAAGGSVYGAAQELGISEVTLGSWLQKTGGVGKLREVVVKPSAQARRSGELAGLTVTTASGHVVTGLTVEQAAQLLRALS